MSNSVDNVIQEMKIFIEEFNKAQEELKRDRKTKLRELIERLYKKFLKEEKDDEAIQEMRKFIDECSKAQEELSKKQGLKLTELIEKLKNFKSVKTVYGQAAREVVSR